MATANEKARAAAWDWAAAIANNNTYHYGRSKWGHHAGCPFCGTNGKNSAKHKAGGSLAAIKYTYCCNPFVTAAYHHGAKAPSVNCKKSSMRINLANDKNKPFENKKEWKRISKPKKATDLIKGDVLQTPTHVMLTDGAGRVAHAKHHDNGKRGAYWNESICVEKIPASQWKRTTKIWRYIGNGGFTDDPKTTKYRVKTNGSNLNVRAAANSSAKITAKLKNGAIIEVIEIKDGWAKLLDGGYCFARYIVKEG